VHVRSVVFQIDALELAPALFTPHIIHDLAYI